MDAFEYAKKEYEKFEVDVCKAMETLKEVPVSLHCWQLDDVSGFDNDGALTGGIQTTGNYPGKASSPDELFEHLEKVMSLIPGKAKLNIHASYAIFGEDGFKDRNELEPRHFKRFVDFAKKHSCGLDFNPTFFSHEKAGAMTLSSSDEKIRKFWVEHGKACIRISEYFARETGIPCVMNIWTGDGLKDIPADRMGPRMRYKKSVEEILSEPFDRKLVKPCIESKVFGIGVESYTSGSAEFALLFAASHEGCMPLMDNGHYHPTECVSDKIPALLCFFPEIALHITRPVRWDSDHVVLFDDETREMAKEIIRCNALNRVHMALDYFDASINRIFALAEGFRSWQKALLYALCLPNARLKRLQDEGDHTRLMAEQEACRLLPFCIVWDEYLKQCGAPSDMEMIDEVKRDERARK